QSAIHGNPDSTFPQNALDHQPTARRNVPRGRQIRPRPRLCRICIAREFRSGTDYLPLRRSTRREQTVCFTRWVPLDVLVSLAAVIVASTPASAQQQRPNVVFILADNVGYGDLGPYGGGELRGAPTPRIDQLAREGLRLTQFLVEPACTPSRAA